MVRHADIREDSVASMPAYVTDRETCQRRTELVSDIPKGEMVCGVSAQVKKKQ